MKRILLITTLLSSIISFAQTDKEVIREIYTQSLTNGKSYDWLNHLSNQIGGRLSGSLNAEKAVAYTKAELEKLGLDKVWLQPVMVPKWIRGAKEFAYIETAAKGFDTKKTTNVNICALGGSVATPAIGLKANIVEVKNFEELETLGKEKIENPLARAFRLRSMVLSFHPGTNDNDTGTHVRKYLGRPLASKSRLHPSRRPGS